MVPIVGDDVWGAVFRIQCAFPNMEGVAMLNEKRENHKNKGGWCSLLVMMFGVLS